jgi:hypothetical protein
LGHRRVRVYMVMKTASAKSRWRRWRRGTWRKPVGRVKEEGEGSCLAGGRTRVDIGGLMVWASKPSVAGLRVWASKLGRRFRGRTDGTWWHRGVHVEVKLPVRRRCGCRIKMKTGLDLYALELNGLAYLYPGGKLRLCNSPVK